MRASKQNLYNVLEGMPRSTRGMQIFDALMIALILLNVVAVIIETVDSFADEYHDWFFYFEVFEVMIRYRS